jgi:hypothetical protein
VYTGEIMWQLNVECNSSEECACVKLFYVPSVVSQFKPPMNILLEVESATRR